MNNDDERDYAEEQYNRRLLDDEPRRGLKMGQLVSVRDYGLGNITAMKTVEGIRKYRIRLIRIPGQPAQGITVTRDQIED